MYYLKVMKRGITQKEIARKLGVSQALVSRALSGTAEAIDASPVTVDKIRKAALEWNYSPNAAALTLKGAPSRTLAVVIKNFDDPFFGYMIRILQGLGREQGYGLLLVGWEEARISSADELILQKYQPDGLIVCGSDYCPPAIKAFLNSGKPVVQIGLGRVLKGVRQVVVDEAAGLKSLVKFLANLGHDRFGYVGDASISQRRREAFLCDTLRESNLAIHSEWFIRLAEPSGAAIREAMGRLLARGQGRIPSVIIAADDAMAQQVMRSFHEHGVRVPAEISLAGIDDIPSAGCMIPALTSVRQPVAEMARHAFQLVTGNGAEEVDTIICTPSLQVRESCAPPHRAN